ncbi:MAG TPA: O-acetyl-ADP-ribose deacetylase [Pyrinomonadaceae bacterium]|nr:O-acetyl-ADP-ribose deacetylase [Pyrinomonadaceae bacterium]
MSHSHSLSFLGGRVSALISDIAREQVDAIVNAANSSLLGGGGVDGAIHRAGGPTILAECREIRRNRYPEGLPPGEAVLTSAGELPARHVIHTVGPVYGSHDGQEAELLANCYRNSFLLAAAHGLSSIAFPAISTGVFGYPREEAAVIASTTIEEILQLEQKFNRVHLVFFKDGDLETFLANHRFTRA